MKSSLSLFSVAVVAVSFFLGAQIASAHVVVKPNQVGVASFQTFTMGVPVEKDVATVGLRLLIPDGLQYVSPNVKPGWKITVTKVGEGEAAKVTEISWSGGLIPAGQRDDFLFSAKVPAEAGVISWKAYQTYTDGSVVSWDNDPATAQPMDMNGKADFSSKGPLSQTKIVDDLKAATTKGFDKEGWTLTLSLAAFALSLFALQQARKGHGQGH